MQKPWKHCSSGPETAARSPLDYVDFRKAIEGKEKCEQRDEHKQSDHPLLIHGGADPLSGLLGF